MPELVMTSGLKEFLVALLILGATGDSARPVMLEDRLAKLGEAPALVIPDSTGPRA